jgi:hypothetical protein
MSRPNHELSEIIALYGTDFEQKHAPTHQQRSVLAKLSECRTSPLGGHVDACDACGTIRISYNSCRNRHCPKCQATSRERWIEARENDLLDVSYFHVVFTLPEELNPLFLLRSKAMYNILFEAVKLTLELFAGNPNYLGAQSGHIAVLHTWGQNISFHPHLHFIVPAGGVTQQGKWKPLAKAAKADPCSVKTESRNTRYATYLYPVKALSKEYSKIFLRLLKANVDIEPEHQPDKQLLRKLTDHKWVVYAKQPFFGPKQVIEYLGRYTHKVAISNHRIKSIDDGQVTFTWKDYRHGDVQKEMTIQATEFLRRFCQHILPFRFVKIRHYGILSSRNKVKLRDVQFTMGIVVKKKPKPSWQEVCKQKLNFDPELCPNCKVGHFHTVSSWSARAPPPADAVHRAAINAAARKISS